MLNKQCRLHLTARVLSAFLVFIFLFGAAPQNAAKAVPGTYYLTAGPAFADTFIGKYPGFALGDVDKDGDPDAVTGEYIGQLTYFANGGGNHVGAAFYRVPTESTTFFPQGLNINTKLVSDDSIPSNPHPLLVDYDKDGDQDLFIAAFTNNSTYFPGTPPQPRIMYFQNNPLAGRPRYQYTPSNPFAKIFTDQMPDTQTLGDPWVTIAVGDLNGDSLPDAVLGLFIPTDENQGYYTIRVFLNNVSNTPVMLDGDPPGEPNPLPTTVDGRPSPELVDIDFDGDLDLFVGYEDGRVDYYENTSDAPGEISFTRREGSANPLDGVDVGEHAIVRFADLDSDRRLDAAIASSDGRVTYLRNAGSRRQPHFISLDDWHSPLEGLEAGIKSYTFLQGGSAPALADLNGDGDVDALAGSYNGQISYFRNEGSSGSPAFTLADGDIFESASYWFSMPALGDLDGDGDPDLLVGAAPSNGNDEPESYSEIYFYRNYAASPTDEPVFTLESPAGVLAGVQLATHAAPALADVDGDGDLDLLIGTQDGAFLFYRNNGTASAPNFELDDPGNPFAAVSIPFGSPHFADVDGDGDLDALVGEGRLFSEDDPAFNGSVHYFRNDGGVFNQQTGSNNPFATLTAREFASPALADLDGDGDLDFISGSGFGSFVYAENVGSASEPVYRDYLFNPLAQVLPPILNDQYSISVNFCDVDIDGDLDAFVGVPVYQSVPSKLLFYKNVGSADLPVFRLQPETQNPFTGIVSDNTLLSVSFGNMDADPYLEAFIGDSDGEKDGFLYYYDYNSISHAYVFASSQPLIQDPLIPTQYEIGPRISFVQRTGSPLLDAFIFVGYLEPRYGVYYAENMGDSNGPRFEYTGAVNWLDEVGTEELNALNPFYAANRGSDIYFETRATFSAYTTGSFPDPHTVWIGNEDGEVYTMNETFWDQSHKLYYMDRVYSGEDPFNKVRLLAPVLPSAVDTNADGMPEAYLAAADGRVHYFRGTNTPPPTPEPDDIYLPIIVR